MCRKDIQTFGIGLCCFATGTIVQILLPDVFIVTIFACVLLAVGVLLLKG